MVVGVSLAGPIPKRPPARLEYVIWTDRQGGQSFQAFDSFPNDPADGMNGAFGVVFEPGEGWRTFALEFPVQGNFEHTETDTLAAAYGDQMLLAIPLRELQGVRRVNYHAFGTNDRSTNFFFPQFSGQDQTEPMPLALDTLPVANLTVSQPTASPSPDGPRVSTEPTGGGALRQFFILILVIGGVVIAVGGYIFWTTRERRRPGQPETPGEVTTGPGETPGPTPGVTPGWITETPPPCDWAAYYVPGGGKPDVVIRAATGKECCVYRVKVSTHVHEREQVTRERQGGPSQEGELGRRNFESASVTHLGIDGYVEASSRSGPEGSPGWMQGLGDSPDRGGQTALPPEPWPGGSTPDGSGSARLDEVTSLSVTLESDCPGHLNTFDTTGSSSVSIGANQECTNKTDGECPVELTASAWAVGQVDGAISYSAAHLAGGDPNELEAALAALGDGQRTFHPITDLHDHEELDRSDYVGGDDASGSAQTQGDALRIDVRNFVALDAGSLVPVDVWPSTARVTASIEASLQSSFDVSGDMKRTECVDGPCCGGLPCSCEPALTVHMSGESAKITAGGNTLTVTRPGAVVVGQDQGWEPA